MGIYKEDEYAIEQPKPLGELVSLGSLYAQSWEKAFVR